MTPTTTATMLEVRNPADGRLVETISVDDRDAVTRIATELRLAQVTWAEDGPRQRSQWLHQWRDWILAHTDELTDLLQAETGKVRPDALVETTASCEFITYYANHAEAKIDIADYIAGFYNPVRLHSTLGYRSPVEHELVATAALAA